MQQLTKKVAFDLIRYANCWEDVDVLLEGLNTKPNSKILSIASAGDNSFSLLTTNPEIVVAIDVNEIQLHLTELKKVCFEHLDYHEMLIFLGLKRQAERGQRLQIFYTLRTYLSYEAQAYWQAHLSQIKAGILSQGKFEKYFQTFSQKLLPWIHSEGTIDKLLAPKSAAEQKEFYDSIWNTWRWRGLFKIFFSKYIMGKYGRDPQFLKEVKVPVSEFIFQKAGHHLSSIGAQNNFMLHYQLTGSFGSVLPHYLRPENFELIKANIHKLQLREGYAEMASEEFGQFDYMNLSNIFEYMDEPLFESTANKLASMLRPNGKMAYWNLMVPRKISTICPEQVNFQQAVSGKLTQQDKGFFYQQFIIDQLS